jgi:hypothetical protein
MARTNVGPAKWSTVCAVLLSAAALLYAARPSFAQPPPLAAGRVAFA